MMTKYLHRYRLLIVIYGCAGLAAFYEYGYLQRPAATNAGLAQPLPASDVLIELYPDSPMATCLRADQALYLTYDLPAAKRLLEEALGGGYKGDDSYFYNYATVLMLMKADPSLVDEAVANWRRHDLTTDPQLDPRLLYRQEELPAALPRDAVSCLARSRDGKKVVFARQDNLLWLAQPGSVLDQPGLYVSRRLPQPAHRDMVSAIALGANDTQVISGSLDGELALWDLATGEPLQRIPAQRMPGRRHEIYGVAAFPGDTRCVVVDRAGIVRIWDLRTAELLREFRGADCPLSAVSVSPDGTMVATGDWSGQVKLWDLEDEGHQPRVLEGHRGVVNRIIFLEDGNHVGSCSRDATARVWELATGQSRVFAGHGAPVYGLDVSPDGKYVVTASEDRRIKVWSMETGAVLYNLATQPDARPLYAVLFAADSKAIVWDGFHGIEKVALD